MMKLQRLRFTLRTLFVFIGIASVLAAVQRWRTSRLVYLVESFNQCMDDELRRRHRHCRSCKTTLSSIQSRKRSRSGLAC